MLNHIIIMGRLTRDPELRYTQSQTPVASFTLAVDRDFGNKDNGTKQTDFIDCVAWRQTGEFVNKYFSKGRMAVVSGRLQIRDWTDRDGNKRRSAEVVAESVYFGDSKKDDGQNSGYSPNHQQGGYNQAQPPQAAYQGYGQPQSYGQYPTQPQYQPHPQQYPQGQYQQSPQYQQTSFNQNYPSRFQELDDDIDDCDLPF